MSNLESTRPGLVLRSIGVLFMLIAIGLAIWDIASGNWIWPVNIVSLACGAFFFHTGMREMRRAREHRQFMEQRRAEIARLRGKLQ